MSNQSSMVVSSPVYTLVPGWLYNFLGLHQFYESSKYSVVTQMPGAMFSNQKPCYLLRCSTFTQTINLPFDAFHDEKLRRSLYDLNIQGASIEDINVNNASDITRITTFIDIHNEIIANTSRNTTLNNVIDSAHAIIDSAHAIIDSAHAINGIAKDIVYNTSASVLHHSEALYTIHDTIARGTSHISKKATDVLLNYKHCNDNHNVNTYHALEIISAADEVITKADKIITKASNDISLANEAHKKLQAESISSWINWKYVVPAMCTAAILIMVTTTGTSSLT